MNKEHIKNNESFKQAIEGLNDEQKKAVNQIEGPVMVLAGPGTGKTQILAARIGKILSETDAEPHNILCLTYTEAGTVAMRRRLQDFIGADAYRVNIYTFHAFCNHVIQSNIDYFMEEFGASSLKAMSDLDRKLILKEIIDELPNDNILKRFKGEVYYNVPHLEKLFSIMRREAWGTEYMIQKTDEYIADLPFREEYIYKKKSGENKAGDPKTKDIAAETDKMNNLKAGANLYHQYIQKKQVRGLYDFEDMILWVIKAFEQNPDLLINHQERFLYVLVDEFQDTSGAQNKLINQLMSFWDVPNLFVVGDDDQSIYRFQGANVENILQFEKQYSKGLCKIKLTDNYRSTQSILNTAKSLIDHKNSSEDYKKTLWAKNTDVSKSDTKPRVVPFELDIHELSFVKQEVSTLLESGVDANEIAIIYRNHDIGNRLADLFFKENIPLYLVKKTNALNEPLAIQILNILKYLTLNGKYNENADQLFFEILHYPYFNSSPSHIAQMVEQYNQYRKEDKNNSLSLKTWVAQAIENQTLNISERLVQAITTLENLSKKQFDCTVQEIFENVVQHTNMIAYIMHHPHKYWLMQVLAGVFNLVKQETEKNPSIQLRGIIEYFNLMDENELSLELNRVLYSASGVNFVSCHSSKGLEWKHVYFIGTNATKWKNQANKNSFKLPDTLFDKAATASPNSEENLEELRRLFYVAITRAKSHLTITYSGEGSQFISELTNTITIEEEPIKTEDITQNFIKRFELTDITPTPIIDKNLINPWLDSFVMNATALNGYLRCPVSFYFDYIVKPPKKKERSSTFGSAVHHALRRYFELMKSDPNQSFPAVEQLSKDFDWFIERNKDAFTDIEYKRHVDYAHIILPKYHKHYIEKWNKNVLCEFKIDNVEVNGVPIKGTLDKIEFDGKTATVVDYKTGKYNQAKPKLSTPNIDKGTLGGDYWRQGVFYKILLESNRNNDWSVQGATFDFVEPEKEDFLQHKFVYTADDVQIVKKQITETYDRIHQMDFNTGCGEEKCHWCNFVKGNFDEFSFAENDPEL